MSNIADDSIYTGGTQGALTPINEEYNTINNVKQAPYPNAQEPEYGTIRSLWNTAKEDFTEDPLYKMASAAYVANEDTNKNFPILSDDQITQMNKERQGLDIPFGTRSNAANTMVNRWENKQARNYIDQNSSNDVFTELGKLGINVGSFAIDPLNTAMFEFGAPELIGASSGITKMAIGDLIKSGMKAGLSYGIGSTAINEATNKELGEENLGGIKAINDIMNPAIFGGALGATAGFLDKSLSDVLDKHTPITPEDDGNIKEAAAVAAANGKDFDPTIFIKNALYKTTQNLKKKLSDIGKTPDDVISDLDEGKQKVTEKLDDVNTQISNLEEKEKSNSIDDNEKDLLSNLREQKEDLLDTDQTHDIYKQLLSDDNKPVSDEELRDFARNTKDDFSNNVNKIKTIPNIEDNDLYGKLDKLEKVTSDLYDDHINDIKERENLKASDKDDFDNIELHKNRMSVIRKMIDAGIKCVGGFYGANE